MDVEIVIFDTLKSIENTEENSLNLDIVDILVYSLSVISSKINNKCVF
jgi:hypothetical protein